MPVLGGRAGAVPELHAAVTDTHPLIYHAAGRGLSAKAAAAFTRCEAREFLIYVPAVVIWECSLLARVGRVDFRRDLRAFFDDLFSNPAFQPLDMTPDQVFIAVDSGFTRDPFDALICAAATKLELPLITRDAAIRSAGVVRVLW
jgi:PIN domain nuclease of toxin-antitoxin system